MSSADTDYKTIACTEARMQLQAFLQSSLFLEFSQTQRPRLSVLLVLYNRAELTFACLRSLQACLHEADAEIVLVDNASRDDTAELLKRIRGARILKNATNLGFARAVNQSAEAAAGDYLLLLNNDTEVHADSIRNALHFLSSHDDVGAVGARIMLLDGSLQEAGCAIWRDGHVHQHGRGDNPNAAEYLFQRDVDYCSGTFLMTRRETFRRLGGLDTGFSPAYFEDVDYCVRLWRAGWRVVYLPDATLRHFENASTSCSQEILRLYQRNHLLFAHKHADWLSWKHRSTNASPLWARSSHDDRFKVLYLPARRTEDISAMAHFIRWLRARNCFLTVFPVEMTDGTRTGSKPDVPADVEMLPGGGVDALQRFLAQRRGYYECIVANDPRILEALTRCGVRHASKIANLSAAVSCSAHETPACAARPH